MKISKITAQTVAQYLRLSWDILRKEDVEELNAFLTAAKQFVLRYVGKTEEECDDWEELSIAVLMLCQDMYDNRTAAGRKEIEQVNPALTRLLGLHDYNLL